MNAGKPAAPAAALSREPDAAAAPLRRSPAVLARRASRSRNALAGGALLALIVLAVALAPVISPYGPFATNQRVGLAPMSPAHLMGTDRFGRDIFSRVLWGGRLSLTVGIVSVAIAATTGVALGLAAGYYGRTADAVIMRFVDLLVSFPSILLALAIVATLGSSLFNLMIAVGISAVPNYVRVTRGMVLSLKEREFVMAARVAGCPAHRIITRHILPNVVSPLIVLTTLGTAGAIIVGSTLSFLGLGIQPPTPEWGNMLADGEEFLGNAWWVAFFPGLAIMLSVFAINLLGDGLHDVLDPHLRL